MNRRPFARTIKGDAFAPDLRGGDVVLFVPVARKGWDDMYALADGAIYMAQTVAEGVRLFLPNELYGAGHVVPRPWFEANVRGVRLAELRLKGNSQPALAHALRDGVDFDLGEVQEAVPLALAAA